MSFQSGENGRSPPLRSWFAGSSPQLMVLERVPWYDSTPVLLARLGWFVLVFLAVVFGYPIGSWFARRRRRGAGATTHPVARAATWGSAVFNLTFLLALTWLFVSQQFFYSVSPAMVAIFCLPLIGMALTGVGAYGEIKGWKARSGPRRTRFAGIVVLVTLVMFPLFLWRWNLLGFHF